MNFIADENIDSIVVEVLRSNGHQVRYIAEFDRGVDDDQVFQSANSSDEILITSDKDFGEIVFRQKRTTSGVVLITQRRRSEVRILSPRFHSSG